MPAGADAEAGPPPACVQSRPGPGGRPRQGIRHDGQQILVFLYALIFFRLRFGGATSLCFALFSRVKLCLRQCCGA